jgi:hypothetical protein
VRVDGELGGLGAFLPNDPFDGGASLALIEHDWLDVEDPPAVAHVAVDTDGAGLIYADRIFMARPLLGRLSASCPSGTID